MSLHLRSITTHPERSNFSRSLLIGLLLIGSLLSAQAQSGGGIDLTGTNGTNTIRGRIFFPSGRRADVRVKVKLESFGSGDLSVLADPNGSFSFRSLSPGSYTIVIETEEYETVRETVYIGGGGRETRNAQRSFNVPIYLQPKRTDSNVAKPGVVNAALADVPASARVLYNMALESASKGDNKKAIEQLNEAIATYPQFALALNELGVQYLKLGQVEQAARALQSAVKFSPDEFSPRLNYGIALLNQKKFVEAEAQFRQALKKNANAPIAHMYLGLALMSQHNLDEAEKELRHALSYNNPEVSLAHRYLGGIYWGKRDYKRAADELELYLKLIPKAPDAERTRAAIKELRSKQ